MLSGCMVSQGGRWRHNAPPTHPTLGISRDPDCGWSTRRGTHIGQAACSVGEDRQAAVEPGELEHDPSHRDRNVRGDLQQLESDHAIANMETLLRYPGFSPLVRQNS